MSRKKDDETGRLHRGVAPSARRGRRPVEEITEPQKRALAAIRNYIAHKSFPPTVTELAERLGIGRSSAHDLISQLERKGYVRRDGAKARSIEILRTPEEEVADLVAVPIVGRVAGGSPILAIENVVGELLVESRLVRGAPCFALQVVGDSMVLAGIHDGDYVVVKRQQVAENGQIVVALLGDEATVKRLSISAEGIELRPENPKYRPIAVEPEEEFRIMGKVVAVRRAVAER